jgi:hypothetical protein
MTKHQKYIFDIIEYQTKWLKIAKDNYPSLKSIIYLILDVKQHIKLPNTLIIIALLKTGNTIKNKSILTEEELYCELKETAYIDGL